MEMMQEILVYLKKIEEQNRELKQQLEDMQYQNAILEQRVTSMDPNVPAAVRQDAYRKRQVLDSADPAVWENGKMNFANAILGKNQPDPLANFREQSR